MSVALPTILPRPVGMCFESVVLNAERVQCLSRLTCLFTVFSIPSSESTLYTFKCIFSGHVVLALNV